MNVSISPKRSRSLWPLALGLSGHPMTGMTPEHMQLARAITDGDGATTRRETARGTRLERVIDALLQGLTMAGQAHAVGRGLVLH